VLEVTQRGRLVLAGQVEPDVALPAPAHVVRGGSGRNGPGPAGSPGSATGPADPALMERLRAWRRDVSAAQGVPAYVVFHDRTLAEIAGRRPRSLAELGQVSGVGPAKLERYGEQLLAVLGSSS